MPKKLVELIKQDEFSARNIDLHLPEQGCSESVLSFFLHCPKRTKTLACINSSVEQYTGWPPTQFYKLSKLIISKCCHIKRLEGRNGSRWVACVAARLFLPDQYQQGFRPKLISQKPRSPKT